MSRIKAKPKCSVWDLLNTVSYDLVWESMAKLYPEEEERNMRSIYERIFNDLKNRKNITVSEEWLLEVTFHDESKDPDTDDWYSVTMINLTEPEPGLGEDGEYHTNSYTMSFVPWDEILELQWDWTRYPKGISHEDVAALILWELTFYGYTEKHMEREAKRIFKSANKAIKLIKTDRELQETEEGKGVEAS